LNDLAFAIFYYDVILECYFLRFSASDWYQNEHDLYLQMKIPKSMYEAVAGSL